MEMETETAGLRGSFQFFLVPSLEVLTLQHMASFIKIVLKGRQCIRKESE